MMQSVALREQDLAVLRRAFRRFPAVREVRVFGSRATGHARRASDLDLAISAPAATAAQWDDLCDALQEAPLIYELDLVRYDPAADSDLRKKIMREGITIYPED